MYCRPRLLIKYSNTEKWHERKENLQNRSPVEESEECMLFHALDHFLGITAAACSHGPNQDDSGPEIKWLRQWCCAVEEWPMCTRMNSSVSFRGSICTYIYGTALDECRRVTVMTHADVREADLGWQDILDLEEERKWRNLVSFGRCSNRKSANSLLFATSKFSLLTARCGLVNLCFPMAVSTWKTGWGLTM